MASGSQRATTNQNHGAFQDNHQRRENGNWKNRRQMRPPISEQASGEENHTFGPFSST